MYHRTDQQKLDDARRHTGRVEAQLRQRDKRIAELEAERDALKAAVRKLRTLLSKDGVYSICRTNGEPMTVADAVIIGDVLEAIDEMLEEDDHE